MKKDKKSLAMRKFQNEIYCSCQCPYYQGGSVYSWCNLYNKIVHYDGSIPPLRTPECRDQA